MAPVNLKEAHIIEDYVVVEEVEKLPRIMPVESMDVSIQTSLLAMVEALAQQTMLLLIKMETKST